MLAKPISERNFFLCQLRRATHLQGLPPNLRSSKGLLKVSDSPSPHKSSLFPSHNKPPFFDNLGNVAEFVIPNPRVLRQPSDNLVNKYPIFEGKCSRFQQTERSAPLLANVSPHHLNQNRNYTGCDWFLEKAAGRWTS